MKPIMPIVLICLLAMPALAQRGGGGGRGGGMGGGMGRGGGFGGGFGGGRGFGGGFRPGFGGGFNRGFVHRPFNRFPAGRFPAGFTRNRFPGGVNRFLFNTGFGGLGFGGLGFGGFGLGFPWGGYGIGYGGYPLTYPDYSAGYGAGGNVNVVYPPSPSPQVVYVEPPRPVIHEYDWSSGDTASAAPSSSPSSPVYLIALKDGTIYAASSYRVEAGSFQFLTVDGVKKQTPVESIDRQLTLRLNRERRVPIQLPE